MKFQLNQQVLIMEQGLTGSSPTLNSGTLMIKYCYNSGDILSNNCGGLIGHNQSTGTVTIFNCYNTGDGNSLNYQGGLVGKDAGHNSGTCNIYNCWSSGSNLTDGFVGSAKANGTINIKNCYNISDTTPIGVGILDGSNNYSTDRWYEGYANKTINSTDNLGDITKIQSDLQWYDSFGYDDEMSGKIMEVI